MRHRTVRPARSLLGPSWRAWPFVSLATVVCVSSVLLLFHGYRLKHSSSHEVSLHLSQEPQDAVDLPGGKAKEQIHSDIRTLVEVKSSTADRHADGTPAAASDESVRVSTKFENQEFQGEAIEWGTNNLQAGVQLIRSCIPLPSPFRAR